MYSKWTGTPIIYSKLRTSWDSESTTTFINQSNKLDPETTLYTIFFVINDWGDSFVDGNHLPQAAQNILRQITLLSSPPTSNARNFLITDAYGRGCHNAWGEAWIQSIFDGLAVFRSQDPPLNVAFANFATIWDGVLGPDPGYEAFGYTNPGSCFIDGNTYDDPEHYFYWFDGFMADYVEEVLTQCRV
ncbi:hypothetical protein DEU56DRAFT_903812 [Suillus clintonianus]|uniref:uncharacterized protein n=1 Tax=Suillus clintonianus TaxID=1904413 RepID=UPI001B86EBFF|nr:uncharacterized protein DEU56DRAFT_903812 [Suillus clintonianus]KAG2125118.1 hypothetical protein DEU56DRAFT_903812 [Suillus clintonianus]